MRLDVEGIWFSLDPFFVGVDCAVCFFRLNSLLGINELTNYPKQTCKNKRYKAKTLSEINTEYK
ncbi:hypothetical protein A6E13_00305 [Aliivibrio fischeri]|nr:hypothetical protein A6E13_00305 [Aliivibrio fischeri]